MSNIYIAIWIHNKTYSIVAIQAKTRTEAINVLAASQCMTPDAVRQALEDGDIHALYPLRFNGDGTATVNEISL